MIDLRSGLGFIEKAADDVVIYCQGARNDPQRHRAVHEHVSAAIDVADLTATDELSAFFARFLLTGHVDSTAP